jgi:hypothetical protein
MEVRAYGHVVIMECAAMVAVVMLPVVTTLAVVPGRIAAAVVAAATNAVVVAIAVLRDKIAVASLVAATHVVEAIVVIQAKHVAASNVALAIAAMVVNAAVPPGINAVKMRPATTLPRKNVVETEMAPCVLKIRSAVMAAAVWKAKSVVRMARVPHHVNFLRQAAAPVIRQKILIAKGVFNGDLLLIATIL